MRAINGQDRNPCISQKAEILDRTLQSRVRRPRLLKQVSRDNHEVSFQFDSFLDKFLKNFLEIFTPCLKAILRITQMQVCSMYETESLQAGYTSSNLAVNVSLC